MIEWESRGPGNGPSALRVAALDIPVAYDADVVVVGAGPGGFAAALQAARMGARVMVVEKFDMPGGVHTSGLQGAAGIGIGGIHSELMERFDEAILVGVPHDLERSRKSECLVRVYKTVAHPPIMTSSGVLRDMAILRDITACIVVISFFTRVSK